MPYSSRIEIATYDDLDALKALLESVDEPTDDIDPDFTRFFIVRDENGSRIIGCVGLELFTGRALIREFAIDEEYQQTEMGTSLVKRLLDVAVEAGSDVVYVCAKRYPRFFWNNNFMQIDLDDVPGEIRDSKIFADDCPQVAAFVKKRIL